MDYCSLPFTNIARRYRKQKREIHMYWLGKVQSHKEYGFIKGYQEFLRHKAEESNFIREGYSKCIYQPISIKMYLYTVPRETHKHAQYMYMFVHMYGIEEEGRREGERKRATGVRTREEKGAGECVCITLVWVYVCAYSIGASLKKVGGINVVWRWLCWRHNVFLWKRSSKKL